MTLPEPKRILAIDTSCDETSAAVICGTKIWSNVIASQAQLHKQYGGVFPTVAKQAHKENILPTVQAALQRAGVTADQLGGVAVTQGPGLAPALEVGISFAKEFAEKWKKPLYPVNHIEGHLLSVLAQPKKRAKKTYDELSPTVTTQWPIMSVIVSGGHTEFVLATAPGNYQKIGWTLDDAAGEALDKFGRMVGLGYPAGALVEDMALQGNADAYKFPLPMTDRHDLMMSFSGLKTAARRLVTDLETAAPLTAQQVNNLCASFQKAVFRMITYKLKSALAQHPVKELWIGGGVAANITLRAELRQLAKAYNIPLRVPYTNKLCGDNAAMIGLVASQRVLENSQTFERQPRLSLTTPNAI